MVKEFNSFSELEQLLPKGKRKNNKQTKTDFKPDTKYTKTNDTDFARFSRFEKKAKNSAIQVKVFKTKPEAADLEEDFD